MARKRAWADFFRPDAGKRTLKRAEIRMRRRNGGSMKKMKNGPWKAVITFLLLVLGNALNAAAIACFALPYGMVVSGV